VGGAQQGMRLEWAGVGQHTDEGVRVDEKHGRRHSKAGVNTLSSFPPFPHRSMHGNGGKGGRLLPSCGWECARRMVGRGGEGGMTPDPCSVSWPVVLEGSLRTGAVRR